MTRNIVKLDVGPSAVIFFPGDPHFGAHDERAHDVAYQVAFDCEATRTISPGDTFDSYALSQHPKEAAKLLAGGAIHEETEAARKWLTHWSAMGPIHLIPGNHEERWYAFREANPAFARTEWWHPHRELLDIPGLSFLPRGAVVQVGKLSLQHGHLLRGHRRGKPAHSRDVVLRHYPSQNTGYGHIHENGAVTKTTWKNGQLEYHTAFSVGHLQRLDDISKYEPDPTMQQGFGIIRTFPGGYFEVALHTIHPSGKTGKGRVCRSVLTGKEYRA